MLDESWSDSRIVNNAHLPILSPYPHSLLPWRIVFSSSISSFYSSQFSNPILTFDLSPWNILRIFPLPSPLTKSREWTWRKLRIAGENGVSINLYLTNFFTKSCQINYPGLFDAIFPFFLMVAWSWDAPLLRRLLFYKLLWERKFARREYCGKETLCEQRIASIERRQFESWGIGWQIGCYVRYCKWERKIQISEGDILYILNYYSLQ